MAKEEVEVVAAELAEAGGIPWYPGRERGPLKAISERYRERARVAIAALDRYRASQQGIGESDKVEHEVPENPIASAAAGALEVGRTILYRSAGDRRAYPCRIEQVQGSRILISPDLKACTGWIDVQNLGTLRPGGAREPS